MSETNPILVLVLANGDQIVAEVAEQGYAYMCTNVLQIITHPDENTGNMRMAIIPYLPFCDPDGGLAIPTNMAAIAIPNEELLNHYNTRFGKIITPLSSKIIL